MHFSLLGAAQPGLPVEVDDPVFGRDPTETELNVARESETDLWVAVAGLAFGLVMGAGSVLHSSKSKKRRRS